MQQSSIKNTATNDIQTRQMKKLPVPSQTVSILLESLFDENMDYNKLAAILEPFPSIVVRIIALANSAWSSPATRIDSLEMACARLGFPVVRSISIAIAISSPFDPSRCRPFRAELYWASAFMCADSAAWLASQSRSVEPQVARTAGLLYNLGLLWLVVDQPDNTAQALQNAECDTQASTNALLRKYCGIGYDQAGAMIARAWRLPDTLSNSIGNHRTAFEAIDDALVYHTALACHMVSAICQQVEYQPVIIQKPFSTPAEEQQLATFSRLNEQQDRIRSLARSLCTG